MNSMRTSMDDKHGCMAAITQTVYNPSELSQGRIIIGENPRRMTTKRIMTGTFFVARQS